MRGIRHPEGRTAKACTRCGATKPLADFPPNRSTSDGRQGRCHACMAELARERRAAAGPGARAADLANQEARRRRNMEAVWRYLSTHPCVDCGETDPVVLEFDHVYGEKRRAVSKMLGSFSWAAIAAEMEKCEVRCANCHRRKTATQFAWFTYMNREGAPHGEGSPAGHAAGEAGDAASV